jgi:8-oxo-dGTP pyrophosphatase MutT (NUDIX family)
MQELTIAMALIEQGDTYLLQRRLTDSGIGAGLLGCFGGKIEPGETPVAAIARELSEETTLNQPKAAFSELGLVEVDYHHQGQQTAIHGYSFKLVVDSEVAVEALEGGIVAMKQDDIEANLSQMTPGTQALFEQFVLNKKG